MNKRCFGLLLLFLLSVDYVLQRNAWATTGGPSGGGRSGYASSSIPQCGSPGLGIGFFVLVVVLYFVVVLLHKNSFLNNKYANNNFDITPYSGGEATVQQSDGSMQKAQLQPGSNRIGRNPDSNIVLKDQMASGQHADLYVSENRYVLTDLNSRNGTKVNGQNISQQDVYQGDEIQIGDSFIWI